MRGASDLKYPLLNFLDFNLTVVVNTYPETIEHLSKLLVHKDQLSVFVKLHLTAYIYLFFIFMLSSRSNAQADTNDIANFVRLCLCDDLIMANYATV